MGCERTGQNRETKGANKRACKAAMHNGREAEELAEGSTRTPLLDPFGRAGKGRVHTLLSGGVTVMRGRHVGFEATFV